MASTEIYCTTNTRKITRRRGRPADPDAMVFVHLGLRPARLEFLKLYQTPEEAAALTRFGNEQPHGNLNPALERLIDDLRLFLPAGPHGAKPRGPGGKFLPSGGTSKNAITRRRKREAKQAAGEG